MSNSGPRLDEIRDSKVIVTGASGFIGLNLVRALNRLGAEVLIIDRTLPGEQFSSVEFDWADLRHLNKTYEADYLIHLAAISNAGYAERYPLDTYEVNVLGTVNLLNHVQVKRRVLFPSTALVYEASELPISEEGVAELSSTYALSKNMGEQIIKFHCNRMGVDHTIVRFFNVYGVGQLQMYIVPQVLRQIIEEERVVVRNGSVKRDLLYVEDCIEAVLKLITTPSAADNTFNIGSGRLVSILDLAHQAAEISEIPEVEVVDLQQNIDYSPTAIVADIQKVQATIDWQPSTSLKQGLKRMWDSYTSHKQFPERSDG